MQIECKLKRETGTIVTLDDDTYIFAPMDAEAHWMHTPHVAEVSRVEHVEILLAIPEAYAPFSLDSDVLAAMGMIVEHEDAPIDNPSDAGTDEAETSVPQDADAFANASNAELRDEYAKAFGQAAKKNASRATLIAALKALPKE